MRFFLKKISYSKPRYCSFRIKNNGIATTATVANIVPRLNTSYTTCDIILHFKGLGNQEIKGNPKNATTSGSRGRVAYGKVCVYPQILHRICRQHYCRKKEQRLYRQDGVACWRNRQRCHPPDYRAGTIIFSLNT
jgi:hypothetical protein